MIQSEPLAFGSADVVRAHLVDVDDAVHTYGRNRTATRTTYDLLANLYADDIASDEHFSERLAQVYEARFEGAAGAEDSFLADSVVAGPCAVGIEPAFACQSHLSLLATIAVSQGNNGAYLKPYVRAHRLARTATTLRQRSTGDVPAAYNILGIALKNMMALHPQYVELVSAAGRGAPPGRVSTLAGDGTALSELNLARRAIAAFDTAQRSADNRYNRARYFNNSADTRLIAISRNLLDEKPSIITDELDRAFMMSLVGVGPTGGHNPATAAASLHRVLEMTDSATTYARQPAVFFTRAQARSVCGSLIARGRIAAGGWPRLADLRSAAVADLAMARQLGMNPGMFSRERANALRLEWLWADPATAKAIAALASPGTSVARGAPR